MFSKFRAWYKSLPSAGLTIFWIFAVIGIFAVAQNSGASNAKQTSLTDAQKTSQKKQAKAQPKVEVKTETQTEAVAYERTTVDDPNLAEGKQELRTSGKNGVRTKTYKVTYTDGKETARELLADEVTTAPVTEVTAHGTYVAPKPVAQKQSACDPNYSGCVPIASDVDCASGSGDGPAYVRGPVYVIGSDIYDLDRDGDGVGCQS